MHRNAVRKSTSSWGEDGKFLDSTGIGWSHHRYWRSVDSPDSGLHSREVLWIHREKGRCSHRGMCRESVSGEGGDFYPFLADVGKDIGESLPWVCSQRRLCSLEAGQAPSSSTVGRKRRGRLAVSLLGSSKLCAATRPTALLCQNCVSQCPAPWDP
jgi:hypothetical protein